MSKKGKIIAIIAIVVILIIIVVIVLMKNKNNSQEVTESTKQTSGLAGINIGSLLGGLFSAKANKQTAPSNEGFGYDPYAGYDR